MNSVKKIPNICNHAIADHLFRTPLCKSLQTWKKVAYCVGFIFTGLLSLFFSHLIYNCCLRSKLKQPELPKTAEEIYNEELSAKRKNTSSSHLPPSSLNIQPLPYTQFPQPNFSGEVPTLKELSLKVLKWNRQKEISIQAPHSLRMTSLTLLTRRTSTLDLKHSTVDAPNDLLSFAGTYMPQLQLLHLPDCCQVSPPKFVDMCAKCPELISVRIAFEMKDVATTLLPFENCRQLNSIFFKIKDFNWEHFHAIASHNPKLKHVTAWCYSFDSNLFKNNFNNYLFHQFESLSIITPYSSQLSIEAPFESLKHKKQPIAYNVAYIDISRAELSLHNLSEQSFFTELQDRISTPAEKSKNFNYVAFKEWLVALKHSPQSLQNYLAAMMFHYFEEKKSKQTKKNLCISAHTFAEELNTHEIARWLPHLVKVSEKGAFSREKVDYTEIWKDFLTLAKASLPPNSKKAQLLQSGIVFLG